MRLCNPSYARTITEAIGAGWITDLNQLQKLKPLADDASFQQAFCKSKREAKVKFADWLKTATGKIVDADSIFDCQIKRIHEYKRQLLNALRVIVLYNRLGEDGPTHQPVEHLASLRAMPGMVTLRPGDANEVVEAYRYIMKLRHKPAVLVLSRQPLPTLDRSKYAAASGLAQGAYVLGDVPGGKPEVILIATGSEVSLVVAAHEKLLAEGIRSRVISMPSWDVFEDQTKEYQESVLPSDVLTRVAVEQASTFGWERYVGAKGRVIGMHTFGPRRHSRNFRKSLSLSRRKSCRWPGN